MTVVSMCGETLARVEGQRNTMVEDVKKKIAEQTMGANLYDNGDWRSYNLLYGTIELKNKTTLADNRLRGDVTLSLVLDDWESESSSCRGMSESSSFSGMSDLGYSGEFVDYSD